MLHIGRCSAGSCAVAQTKFASCSVRFVPDQRPDDLVAKLRAHVEAEFQTLKSGNSVSVKVKSVGDWWEADPQSKLFRLAENALHKVRLPVHLSKELNIRKGNLDSDAPQAGLATSHSLKESHTAMSDSIALWHRARIQREKQLACLMYWDSVFTQALLAPTGVGCVAIVCARRRHNGKPQHPK